MKVVKKILLLLFLLNCINPSTQAGWLDEYCNKSTFVGYAFGLVASVGWFTTLIKNKNLDQQLKIEKFRTEEAILNNEILIRKINSRLIQNGLRTALLEDFKSKYIKLLNVMNKPNKSDNNLKTKTLQIRNIRLEKELKAEREKNKQLEAIIKKSIEQQRRGLPQG